MKKTYHAQMQRVNCLSKELDAIYHQAALRFGISDSVLLVLYMIYEKGEPCLLSDICRESGTSKQTINSAIRKLEQEGVLYLEADKGKTKHICLTEQGKVYVAETAARLFEAECNAFADWTEEEMEQYLHLMEKYNRSLRAQMETV